MIPGTTPKHYFTSPCDVETIDKVNLVYKQGDEIVLIKKSDSFTIEGDVISTRLTREESLNFTDGDCVVKVQAIIVTLGGDVLESKVKTFGVAEVLYDGEIE